MAKRTRKANGKDKQKQGESGNVKPSEVHKMPTMAKVRELARSFENTKESVSEISGRLGSALRTAAENNNLHLGAFRQAMKEKRMEPARLNDFYAHLDFYRDVLGLLDKAESAPRLPLADDQKGEEASETEEGNVVQLTGAPPPAA